MAFSQNVSFDRGAPTPVLQNQKQARQDPSLRPPWSCRCRNINEAGVVHCQSCGLLRPDIRAERVQARAAQGLGRGGGYFERGEPANRILGADEKVGDTDVYGRRRFPMLAGPPGGSSAPRSGPRNSITYAGTTPTKAERQKAALERLHNPARWRKLSLSPLRTRNYREPTSRSRSREKKRRPDHQS